MQTNLPDRSRWRADRTLYRSKPGINGVGVVFVVGMMDFSPLSYMPIERPVLPKAMTAGGFTSQERD